MTRYMLLLCAALCAMQASCGKRGALSLPDGTESLPPDPSQRDNPPG